MTVWSDGAAWIWTMGLFLFGRVAECLDIFHALEHISKCGKVLYKDAKEFQHRFEEMRLVLLQDGFAGIDTRLQTLLFDENWLPEEREAVQSLQDYLEKHKRRMNYRERVGGVERVNRIALICVALYSNQWKHCWNHT
ncbi:hypothetical protein FACS189454_04240 [Planctomycetales bacterium]|nr:hypothetical protein FACS189454_04240 [Planctomycetales bacterium]